MQHKLALLIFNFLQKQLHLAILKYHLIAWATWWNSFMRNPNQIADNPYLGELIAQAQKNNLLASILLLAQ